MGTPSEVAEYHTRILRCSLEVEHSRAYWSHAQDAASSDTASAAFNQYWFGARSLPRVELLLAVFRERFDAFPPALSALHRWDAMDSADRRVICHWHMQLADRIYREFTGEWLVERMAGGRVEVNRDLVVRWIDQMAPKRWATSTRIQIARKLLYSATEVELVKGSRDPRQLQIPRVSDHALTYLLYLLRGVQFQGSLIDNPYLASVGISGSDLDRRLRKLPALRFRRQGDLIEFGWQHESLLSWAEEAFRPEASLLRGTA
jgi:hypothetical protein